jgi:hypothetical protein
LSTPPFMIGIAGTHSTGKSTFVSKAAEAVAAKGLRVGRISDLATKARDLGFPILTEHTYESTLWIMAEGMRQEAEALLRNDVVLVDRPVPDALGYLTAALEVSKREIDAGRLAELHQITAAHVTRYDLLVVTVLDQSIPLGPDRDVDAEFRSAAARHVAAIVDRHRPRALRLTSGNAEEVLRDAVGAALAHSGMGAA